MSISRDIAELFDQIADVLEYRQENPFRIRAYRRAAQQLQSLTKDLAELNKADQLTEIPGIGKDLASKIREYLTHGSIREVEELKRTVPAGLFTLLGVPGVGPKTAKLLYDRLKISSVDELETAAKAHRLCRLPGFQETKEQNILKGIAVVRKGQERIHLGLALPLAREIIALLRDVPGVRRVEVAGSLRRMRETIGDLDLLATSVKPGKVMEALTTSKFCARVLVSGSTKTSMLTPHNLQIDLRVVEPESFGAALQYFTGSKEHNVRLREMAVRKGLKINEYGVFKVKGGKRVAGREEEDVYAALGLPWMPPEIRENTGELEAAVAGQLPRLVTPEDLRGDFHIHTERTDGTNTLEELAAAGIKRGYDYLVICDHSQSLKVAHGLSPEQLKEETEEIRALNRKFRGFRLLTGAEVDILKDGVMDYPDEVLRQLDFVIGSIHSGFRQDEATITNRLVNAMRNPYVTMIAHPTGRLLGQRDPYAVNLESVVEAAHETGTALEINAYPQRLDLNDLAARRAKDRGVMLAVSTDTHQLGHLDNITTGLGVARRAWVEPHQLLNCLDREALLAWVSKKRQRGH